MFKTVGDLIKALQTFDVTAQVQVDNKTIQSISKTSSGAATGGTIVQNFDDCSGVDAKSRCEAASEIQALRRVADISRKEK